MTAYRDERDGRWRYRKRVKRPDGTTERIGGTPPVNTKVAAEAAERAHIERVLHPERAAPPKPEPAAEIPTIASYATSFMSTYLPDMKPSERRSKEQILKGHLLPAFGHLRLDEIRQSHVDAFVGEELTRVARKTINNRLAVLSSLLGYAAENKIIPPPGLRLFLPRKGAALAPQIVAVSAPDVARLLAAATDARYRVAVLLASEAGLRIGEILGLQWDDIRDGEIRVRRAADISGEIVLPKHDKFREIPTSPALVAELEQLPRRGPWVVGRLDGGMLGYWSAVEVLRAIYQRAGVAVPVSEAGQTRPWHSLRHSFGTECAARGVPIGTLRELMGHADVATTMRYVTITRDHKVAAITLAFGQQLANEPPKTSPALESSTEI